MTAQYDFTINQGSDRTIRFVVKAMLAYHCENLYKRARLTGYSAAMELRTSADAEEAALTLTTSNGKMMLEEDIGYINVYFSHEDTAALKAGKYVYDLEIKMDEENKVYRILEGTITVSPEVTKVNG